MIPAILNHQGGNAEGAKETLVAAREFTVQEVEPDEIQAAVTAAMRENPARIAVSGGDGTLASAVIPLVGTDIALAVLPGGTLNHFARDHGIPTDLETAAKVAATGRVIEADVAYAGDRLFINTSSVGAYVSYVRVRERFKKYLGYRLASIVAALRLLFTFKLVSIQLEADGAVRQYKTPLVFIGVGERDLKAPAFGARTANGRRCLHIMVIRERQVIRLMTLAFSAAVRGIEPIAQTSRLDSYFVDRCTIGSFGRSKRVALDGEVIRMRLPIEYRISVGALKVVVPEL